MAICCFRQALGEFTKEHRYPLISNETAELLHPVRDKFPDLYNSIVHLPVRQAKLNVDGAVTYLPPKLFPMVGSNALPEWRRVFYQKQKSIFSLSENELIYIGLCRHSHEDKSAIVDSILVGKSLLQLRNRLKNARKVPKASTNDIGRNAICRFKFPSAVANKANIKHGTPPTPSSRSASATPAGAETQVTSHPGHIVSTNDNALTRIVWSSAEDSTLEYAVKHIGLRWDKIHHSYFPHRGPTQLRRRWMEKHDYTARNFRRREQRYLDSLNNSRQAANDGDSHSGDTHRRSSSARRRHPSWLTLKLSRYPLGLTLYPPSSESDDDDANGDDSSQSTSRGNEGESVGSASQMYRRRQRRIQRRLHRLYPCRKLPQPFALTFGLAEGETNDLDKDYGADSESTEDFGLDDSDSDDDSDDEDVPSHDSEHRDAETVGGTSIRAASGVTDGDRVAAKPRPNHAVPAASPSVEATASLRPRDQQQKASTSQVHVQPTVTPSDGHDSQSAKENEPSKPNASLTQRSGTTSSVQIPPRSSSLEKATDCASNSPTSHKRKTAEATTAPATPHNADSCGPAPSKKARVKFSKPEDKMILVAWRDTKGPKTQEFWTKLSRSLPGQERKSPADIEARLQFLLSLYRSHLTQGQ